eukprot:3409835-Alexandrium_andersonii.AAC.1
MGFLRSRVVVRCECVEHRHHYAFAAESRMGWMPKNLVAGSSALGGLCRCASCVGGFRSEARRISGRRGECHGAFEVWLGSVGTTSEQTSWE